ncbi:MAG: outer membrane beta-barrel protein [Gemmatimonadota bacterium]|nr:outer membrane beta-barrel protein [Gemmatimonadota bacterium]
MRSRWTALLAAALPLLAGPGAAAQVTLGIGVGASSSDLIVTGLAIDSQEARRGITLSVSLAVPVSERIGIEFGTGYIRRGSTSTLLQLGDVDYRIQYLQFSALGKASAPVIGQRLSVHLLAGPALALETSCEREARLVLQPITFLVECDAPEADSRTSAVDYGILGGVGARFAAASRLGFRLDFIYTRGLRSFFESETETTAKNRALTLQAGVDFRIG